MNRVKQHYLLAGHNKLVTALGGFDGDPYDEAVRRLTQTKDTSQVHLHHLGGGWYELPDGSRVRGRDAALSTLGFR